MFKLNDTGRTPHNGWEYEVRETKVLLTADSYYELVDLAAENLSINNIEKPRDILEAEIQDYICQHAGDGFCKGFKQKFVMGVKELINGTTAFFSMMRYGTGSFVSSEKAEERAAICVDCSLNVPVNGCFTCHGFEYAINKARAGRTTSVDDKLNVCAECKCFLRAMVHVDVNILVLTTNQYRIEGYPDYCWKKKELNNHLGVSK